MYNLTQFVDIILHIIYNIFIAKKKSVLQCCIDTSVMYSSYWSNIFLQYEIILNNNFNKIK